MSRPTIRDILRLACADNNHGSLDDLLQCSYDHFMVESEFVGDDSFVIKVTAHRPTPEDLFSAYAIGVKTTSTGSVSYGMTHGPFRSVRECLDVLPMFINQSSVILGLKPEGQHVELYSINETLQGGLCWGPPSI